MLRVEWIEAFLSNRSQIVVLDGTSSDSVPVTYGVPQGSVLGPALFLLYINDLPDTIYSQVRLFADDTVLYRTIKSDTDHHRLQTDLDKLYDWAKAWDMQFHPDKCLVMNISKKRHPSKFTYSLHNTHRTDCRLVLLFQIIHGLVQIPPTNYLQPSLNTTSRKNHNYTYITMLDKNKLL